MNIQGIPKLAYETPTVESLKKLEEMFSRFFVHQYHIMNLIILEYLQNFNHKHIFVRMYFGHFIIMLRFQVNPILKFYFIPQSGIKCQINFRKFIFQWLRISGKQRSSCRHRINIKEVRNVWLKTVLSFVYFLNAFLALLPFLK